MFIYNLFFFFFMYRPWIWVGWCWTSWPTSNDRRPLLRLRAIKMFAAWNRNRHHQPPTNSTFLLHFSWSLILDPFLSQANAFPSSLISMHMFHLLCVFVCDYVENLFWLAKRQMIFLFYLFCGFDFSREQSALLGGYTASPRSAMKSSVSKMCFCIGR